MVTGFEDLDGGEDKSTQEYTALTSSSDKERGFSQVAQLDLKQVLVFTFGRTEMTGFLPLKEEGLSE